MGDAPDGAVAVFGDEQRAIMRDGDADRPAPHLAVIDHKAGDEVLVFAGGYSVLEANADDFVTSTLGPVPGAMLGGEAIASIFRGKRGAVVKCEPERSGVRLDQNVGDSDLAVQ